MQAIECVPIMTFPSANVVVTAKEEERENGVINLVRVDVGHVGTACFSRGIWYNVTL